MSVDELYNQIRGRWLGESIRIERKPDGEEQAQGQVKPSGPQGSPWSDVSNFSRVQKKYAAVGQPIDFTQVQEVIFSGLSEDGRFASLVEAAYFIRCFGTSESVRDHTAAMGRLIEGAGLLGDGPKWNLISYALEDLAMLVAEAEECIEEAGYRVAGGKLLAVKSGKGRRPQIERIAAVALFKMLRPRFDKGWPSQSGKKYPRRLLEDVAALLEPFFEIDSDDVKSAVRNPPDGGKSPQKSP